MKNLGIFIIVAAGAVQAQAAGGAWLSYPHSAQNVAEAGGLGVMSQGLNAVALNAAGLADLSDRGQAQLSHSSWAADIRAEHLGAAMQSPWGGVMAVSGSWVDFGAVQGYRLLPGGGLQETNALHPNAGSLEAAWAWKKEGSKIRVGAGASLLRQSLDGEASSMAPAFEAGLKAGLVGGMTAAISLVNVGASLDGSELPMDLRAGLAWASKGGAVQLGAELSDQNRFSQRPDFLAAARFRLAEGLQASVGLQQLYGAAAQPSAGLSFNIGGKVDLDYGFRQQGDIGATHHLSLGLRWS